MKFSRKNKKCGLPTENFVKLENIKQESLVKHLKMFIIHPLKRLEILKSKLLKQIVVTIKIGRFMFSMIVK